MWGGPDAVGGAGDDGEERGVNNGDDVERGVNGDARGEGERLIFGGEVERGVASVWRGLATRSIPPVGHTVEFGMFCERKLLL